MFVCVCVVGTKWLVFVLLGTPYSYCVTACTYVFFRHEASDGASCIRTVYGFLIYQYIIVASRHFFSASDFVPYVMKHWLKWWQPRFLEPQIFYCTEYLLYACKSGDQTSAKTC